MNEEFLENEELAAEYDEVFDDEERVSHAMKLTKENFTIDTGVIDFDDLLIPDPIKNSRKETYLGLSTSIGEMGILSPIHVSITESYADWVDGGSIGEFDGYKYILIDGFRRVWGGFKNGLTRCNAIIWDFKDKDKGADVSLVLSMVLNKNQEHSWMEIWDLYKILMAQSPLSESTLDYLLHLDNGDSTKLKSIMENADRFPEPKEDLLARKKTLQQAFNMLEKMRKEVDKLTEEDNQGISDIEQADGVVEQADGNKVLSDEDVKELLEMDGGDIELSEDDFDAMLQVEVDQQRVGDRHPLDPALKAETMLRDGYQCTCCSGGKYLPMRYKMGILQSHHKISVANSGKDTAENITTVCMTCHSLVHLLIWSDLKFGMSKEEFDNLPEEEQRKLKNIMKLARIDYEAGTRLGKTHKDMMGGRKGSTFKMPGTDLRENVKALKAYSAEE